MENERRKGARMENGYMEEGKRETEDTWKKVRQIEEKKGGRIENRCIYKDRQIEEEGQGEEKEKMKEERKGVSGYRRDIWN